MRTHGKDVNVGQLPALYLQNYGEVLDHKTLGYESLGRLIRKMAQMSSLRSYQPDGKSHWMLTIDVQPQQVRADVGQLLLSNSCCHRSSIIA